MKRTRWRPVIYAKFMHVTVATQHKRLGFTPPRYFRWLFLEYILPKYGSHQQLQQFENFWIMKHIDYTELFPNIYELTFKEDTYFTRSLSGLSARFKQRQTILKQCIWLSVQQFIPLLKEHFSALWSRHGTSRHVKHSKFWQPVGQ